jgi:phospholipid N-methyltransferase
MASENGSNSAGLSLDNISNSLRDHWTFFRLYFKARKLIGSVIPSSPALTTAMLDAARVDEAPVVVEFGAGTGPFTGAILKRMRPDARLLAFEVMPEFIEILNARFDHPRLEIIPHSAEDLEAELDRRGIDKVSSIVCALPFNAFPPELTDRILTTVRGRLADDGVLAIVQQTRFQMKRFRLIFPDVRVHRHVLLNIPPTYVIECRNTRAGTNGTH